MEHSNRPEREGRRTATPPPDEEFARPGAEFTPPGPEILPPGEEFSQGSGDVQPPVRRKSRILLALLLVTVWLAVSRWPGTQPPGEPDFVPPPAQETTAPTPTETTRLETTEPETEEPERETQTQPPTQQTEEQTQPLGQIHLVVYPGYWEGEREAVLLEETYEGADFSAVAVPQPEPQAGYRFLGYALLHRDASGGWISRAISDRLTREDVSLCPPDDTGTIQISLEGVWCGEGDGNAFLPLTLDANGGTGTAQYDAASPKLSGTMVYLAPYPVPVRQGWRFTGWYREPEGGEEMLRLWATDFYGQTNGETDWRISTPVTLYAHWERDT